MPPRKTDTDTPAIPTTVPVAPERLQGLPEGESNINTEYPTTPDGLEVKGPHNIVDTTPLGDNAPHGDARAGVFADPPVPGIDPASNLPIEMMDGRAPRPAAEGFISGQTDANYQALDHKGGVKLRLTTKYWPKDRPDDLPIEMMDGRAPRPAAEGFISGQTDANYQALDHKGGVKLRLTTKYWPKDRPDDLPAETEYVLHPGQEVSLPSEEAMDLLERGHAERVNKRG